MDESFLVSSNFYDIVHSIKTKHLIEIINIVNNDDCIEELARRTVVDNQIYELNNSNDNYLFYVMKIIDDGSNDILLRKVLDKVTPSYIINQIIGRNHTFVNEIIFDWLIMNCDNDNQINILVQYQILLFFPSNERMTQNIKMALKHTNNVNLLVSYLVIDGRCLCIKIMSILVTMCNDIDWGYALKLSKVFNNNDMELFINNVISEQV